MRGGKTRRDLVGQGANNEDAAYGVEYVWSGDDGMVSGDARRVE